MKHAGIERQEIEATQYKEQISEELHQIGGETRVKSIPTQEGYTQWLLHLQ